MRTLLILGAGGYGKTVADVAQQLGIYDKIAFLDDGKSGPEILGKCEEYAMFAGEDTDVYPAFGNNQIRMDWMERLMGEGIAVPTLVHPTAYVSPRAKIGAGTVVLPKAVVNTGVTVESGCIINIGVLIDHDCYIEAGVHLCPGVIVKAENRIDAMTRMESGSVIMCRTYPL